MMPGIVKVINVTLFNGKEGGKMRRKTFTRRTFHTIVAAILVLTIGGLAAPVQSQTNPCGATYQVRPGDSLSRIAVLCQTTVSALLAANPQITNPNRIFPNQILTITTRPATPTPHPILVIPDTGAGERLYTVQRGEWLARIARNFGTTVANLLDRNPQIINPNRIYAGQRLAVPDVQPTPVTPTPVITPTPGPTPTPAPQQVIFQDDFSVANLWFTADTDDFLIEYRDGSYRIVNHFFNAYVNSIRSFNLANVRVEVDAARVAGPETGYYGVVCRWQDVHNFYAMVIGSDGFHGIVRVVDTQITFLGQGRTQDGPINRGTATNRVAGSCVDNTLTLFANGQQLLQVQDQTFESGMIGVMVGTRLGADVDVRFDNFAALRP
jgi:LysM repeat protein